ncbi:MAG: histidinol-phosphatase, partial [Armatimonadetes bacterium]|nr:histidinol-phosphatase [Armatimonadota bacterium]
MTERVPIDLHVHTALSPCASAEMTPPSILLSAERRRIGVLGVVDHNTAGNARAVMEAAPAFGVRVLVGLEIESVEGVHVLALFDSADAAMALDTVIGECLPPRPNRIEAFGEQYLLDPLGEIIGEDPRLLAAAVDLGLEAIVELIGRYGGLSIPAHIDRRANGLLPTLGFIPSGLSSDLWELSPHTTPDAARET